MKSADASFDEPEPTALVLTLAFLAAALLIMAGSIIFMYALFDQTRTTDIIFNLRPGTWRVLMLVGGVVLVAAGGNLFVGKYWARAVGLVVSVLALVAGILHLESEPILAVGLIILNLGILYTLGLRWTDVKKVTG
jgi:hypothetical protein